MPVLSKKKDHQKFVGGFALSGLLGSGRASMLPLGTPSEAFHTFLRHFLQVKNIILLHIILLKCPHIQIAFLKFTSRDNQALVGCIPITAVAVHLNLKS